MKKRCIKDDEMYWELLEEQHEHDVVMTESRKENGSDRETGGDKCD